MSALERCLNKWYMYIQAFIVFFRFRNFAAKSKDELVTLGFPAFTVEDFHDTVSSWGKHESC